MIAMGMTSRWSTNIIFLVFLILMIPVITSIHFFTPIIVPLSPILRCPLLVTMFIIFVLVRVAIHALAIILVGAVFLGFRAFVVRIGVDVVLLAVYGHGDIGLI